MTDDDGPVGRAEAALVLAAALGVVGVLVLIVFVLIGGNDETEVPRTAPPSGTITAPSTGGASTSPSDGTGTGGTVTTLTAPGSSGRCLPPSARVLAGQDLAFDATVVSTERASDGTETVTLAPTRFFTGDPADTVEVQAPGRQLTALLDATTFTDGDRYLVAATDGKVAPCGLSAPYSADLEGLYEQAYG